MATVREILINARANTGDAQAAVAALGDEIRDAGHGAEATINVRQIGTNLDLLQKNLRQIDRDKVTAEVNVKITKALVDVDTLQARLAALPRSKTLDINIRKELNRQLAEIEQAVFGIGKALGNVTEQGGKSFLSNAGEITQTLKSLTPLINGTGIALLTALVPGLIAAAGAAGGAVTALGALGTSLAGVAIPAVGLLAVLFNRLGRVMDAYKATQADTLAQQEDSAKGSVAARDAADKRTNAENALRDALQSRVSAERGLAEARRAAGEAITAADRRVATAEQSVSDAAQAIGTETVDAYRAMQDAAERVRDSVLDLQDAQLGQERANLTLRQARQALKDYLSDLGRSTDEIDTMFKKFTDVDVDAGGLAGKVLGGAGDNQDALDLENLILRVREAKQDEKHATDDLQGSEQNLTRARQDQIPYLRRGIQGYKPLVDAQRRLRDANVELTDASREQARLERNGISRAPAVLTAQDSLRDATERLADARRKLNELGDDPALSTTAAKVKSLTGQLTGAERGLLASLIAFQKSIAGIFQGGTDAIITSMATSLGLLPALLRQLQPQFTDLGKAMGGVITGFGVALALALPQLRALATAATPVTKAFGRILTAGLTTFLDVATAGLPFLVDLLNDAATAMENMSAGVNRGRLGGQISALVEVLRSVAGLAVQVGAALFESFVAVAPYAQDLVDYITSGVKAFRNWLRSARGQREVKRFFEDTLPLVKSIIKFVARIGVTFLRAFQAFSPVLKPTIDLLTDLLGVVDWLIGLFGKIPQPLRTALGDLLAFGAVGRIFRLGGAAIGVVSKIIERLGGNVPRWLGLVEDAAKKVGAALKFTKLPGTIANVGRAIGEKLVGGVRSAGGQLGRLGGWIIARLRGGVGGAANAASLIGLTIIATIAAGARGAWRRIERVGSSVVHWVRTGVSGIWNQVKGIGESVVSGIANGISDAKHLVTNAMQDVVGGIVGIVNKVLDIRSPSHVMYEKGRQTMQGFADGLRSMDLHKIIRERFGAEGMIDVGLAYEGKLGELVLSKLPGGQLIQTAPYYFDGADHTNQLFNRKRWSEIQGGPLAGGVATGLLKIASGLIHAPIRAIEKRILDRFLGLAQGGLVRSGGGGVLAQIGEGRHDEAVLPLNGAVMRQLATALAAQLRFPAQSPGVGSAVALTGSSGVHIENLNLPPAPGHDQLGDPRVQAAQFAREMSRRGLAVPA